MADRLWADLWDDLRHNATGKPSGEAIIARHRKAIEDDIRAEAQAELMRVIDTGFLSSPLTAKEREAIRADEAGKWREALEWPAEWPCMLSEDEPDECGPHGAEWPHGNEFCEWKLAARVLLTREASGG
jgi:hypothetical protein